MRRNNYVVSLFVGFALVASACSGGGEGDSATSPITAPQAASPDAGQDLLDLVTSQDEPVVADTTTTTLDRAATEQHVTDLIKAYFTAAAAHDWDAVYTASSASFAEACTPERYSAIVGSISAEPIEIEFVGEFNVSVVGDFATGNLSIYDQTGTLPVSGLLAVAETDGWRVAIDPCDAANEVASGEESYPLVVVIASEDPPPAPTEATIPPDLTTTTTVPGATTTTTIPGTPLTDADRAAIEVVLQDFMSAYASQDWAAYHAAVPPLFSCTPLETAAQLAPYHFSPTAVAFGPMTITGADDEAVATFDVRFLDSLENVAIELGAWEWGGTWYAAIHPCTSVDLIESDAAANATAITLLEDTLALARTLYLGAGDYDIPVSALNEIEPTATFVDDVSEAAIGTVAYGDDDQDVLIVTQSGSGQFLCIAENAVAGAHYAWSFYLETIDTFDECLAVELTAPWGTL